VGIKFKITGVDKIVRKLKSVEPSIQQKALRKATRAGAKVIQAEAKALVPVDTGALKDAIKVKAGKRKKGRISTLVQVGQGDFKGDTFYGGMIEFGTSKMPARPFMTPAYESKGEEARDAAIDALNRALDQILRKMSVSGRLADKVSKSKLLKQARKSAARKGKQIRKAAAKGAKRARKTATRQAKKARKTVVRKAKQVRKSVKRRRRRS